MFTGFFYLLRAHGFRVSLNEWMTLMEGLMMNLQHASLTGFYELCRAVLVKSEADYDKFDQIFLEYFDGVPYEGDLPEELLNWLNHPENALEEFRRFLKTQGYEEKSIEEILKMFEERLKEQTEEHNGGSYWIGTRGYSNFGNSGHSPQGIRVGGQSMYRRAFQVAGERKYRDFRKDNVLDIRQFQMAFRLLRQYSAQTMGEKTEFDVDGTIRDTCDNAGTLSVRYKRPRRNSVKVLMLMDSGGSMEYYSHLCSMLFQAARQSNHFKELHVYYFHNCIYSSVYTDPRMYREHAVPTDWIRAPSRKEAMPYIRPAYRNTPMMVFVTETPETSAASELPPTANMFLPKRVLFHTIQVTTPSSRKMMTRYGSLKPKISIEPVARPT